MRHALIDADGWLVGVYNDPEPGLELIAEASWEGWPAAPAPDLRCRRVAGAWQWQESRSLAQLKADKNTEINAARMAANRSGFMFAGKLISTDELSRSDIDGTNGTVTLTGGFPAGWPGAWKTDDNSYVAVPDVATWKLFYAAMTAQGSANFATSQALKVQLASATTAAEVAAVVWPT